MAHHSSNPSKIDPHDLGHIVPFKVYLGILGALIVLTVVTVLVAEVDFGALNLVVAMGIASVKALLVALFFMHLKFESPFTWLYAGLPLFFLLILIGGIFIDNPYRDSPKVNFSTVK